MFEVALLHICIPKVPLSAYIRTNPKMHIETHFLNSFNELYQIVPSFKIVLQHNTSLKQQTKNITRIKKKISFKRIFKLNQNKIQIPE